MLRNEVNHFLKRNIFNLKICKFAKFSFISADKSDKSSKWAEKSQEKSIEGLRIPNSRRKTERIRSKNRSEKIFDFPSILK